jgi:hypothetical protein
MLRSLLFVFFAIACFLGALALWSAVHREPERADRELVRISGRVLVNGQPVTGGGLLLQTWDGERRIALIEEDGRFETETLPGEVTVFVNNDQLRVSENRRSEFKYKDGTIKRLQGKYVPLPRRQTYLTVVRGQDYYDIELAVKD